MQEYRISKGWSIIIYLTAPLLIILFGYVFTLPFLEKSESQWTLFLILGPISIGMIIFMLIGLLDTIKGKTIIDEEGIQVITAFSNRGLKFEEIKGFTIDDNYVIIAPISPNKKRLKISRYVSSLSEITQLLSEHYPNLDVLLVEKEEQEILNNSEIGNTLEEREANLKAARKKAKILNWLSGIIAVWTLLFANPYDLAILSSIAIPIIALITVKFTNGIIRFDENNATAYPSIGVSFIFPALALLLRAILDFNIYDYSNVWSITAPITMIILAFIIFGNNEFQFKKAKDYLAVLFIGLFIFAYSFGSVVTLNCYFDNSESEIHRAEIIKKRIDSGKTTTYHLELTQWRNQIEPDEVTVSEELYNQLENGDEVTVYYQNGWFDIPWFFVTD